MFKRKNAASVALVALICIAVSLLSSTTVAATHSLPASVESLVVGGSNCSDFMDGFAVGMGIGALFGCVWCAAGAIGAKTIALFC